MLVNIKFLVFINVNAEELCSYSYLHGNRRFIIVISLNSVSSDSYVKKSPMDLSSKTIP